MLCASMNRFMYEACPDIFPQGYLTEVEVQLWGLYWQDRNEKTKP